MSKLALRIFLSFFAALVLTVLGAIAVTSWLIAERKASAEAELVAAAQEAANALADGGVSSLKTWASSRSTDSTNGLDILVMDENGVDLLGREPPGAPRASTSISDDFFAYDLPAVLLNLPTEMPELISDDGESFRLMAVETRTGLGVFRDVPLPLLLLSLAVTALVSLGLARSITRPIIELQQITEDLAIGKLDSRVSETARSRRDEIGQPGFLARIGKQVDQRVIALDLAMRHAAGEDHRVVELERVDVAVNLRHGLAKAGVAVMVAHHQQDGVFHVAAHLGQRLNQQVHACVVRYAAHIEQHVFACQPIALRQL